MYSNSHVNLFVYCVCVSQYILFQSSLTEFYDVDAYCLINHLRAEWYSLYVKNEI